MAGLGMGVWKTRKSGIQNPETDPEPETEPEPEPEPEQQHG